jgi:hypothetical protein
MRVVHAVPYDKGVRASKTHKIGLAALSSLSLGLLQKHANLCRFGSPGQNMGSREGERTAAVENIIHKQDMPVFDGNLGISQKFNVSGRFQTLPVARENHEIDVGIGVHLHEGAHQICGKYKAALQNRDQCESRGIRPAISLARSFNRFAISADE